MAKHIICAFLVALAVVSCSEQHDYANRLMDMAAKTMSDNPENALKTLSKVCVDSIHDDRKTYARYCLLYSQALDKNYIDLTSDSIIRNAVDYYKDTDDKASLMLSYYYLARVQQNSKCYGDAIVTCYKAGQLAKTLKDYHYLGLAYREMGELYNISYDGEEEVKYCKLSLEAFSKAKEREFVNDAILDLCNAYISNDQFETCLRLVDRFKKKVLAEKDSAYIGSSMTIRAIALIGLGRYKEAKNTFLSKGSLNMTMRDSAYLAYSYCCMNNVDSGLFYHIKKDDEGLNHNIWYTNYRLYRFKGNYVKALAQSEKFISLQDSILRDVISHTTQNKLSDFIVSQKKEELEKAKARQILFLIIGVAIIVFITILSLLRYLSLKNKYLRMESDMVAFQSLRPVLRDRENKLTEMRGSINDLFRQRFETIDQLCGVYYERKGSTVVKNKIYEEVLNIIKSFQSDDKALISLRQIIDRYNNGIMTKLGEAFPNLQNADTLLYMYIIAGFSSRSISIFLNEKLDVVYNRKSRLKNKIAKSDTIYKEELLAVFHK